MVSGYSAARCLRYAAGVCVFALIAMTAACSSDDLVARPPADVAAHAALVPPAIVHAPPRVASIDTAPQSTASIEVQAEAALAAPRLGEEEPLQADIGSVQLAQAYPMPADPSDALSTDEAQRTFVDPDGPLVEEPPMSEPTETEMAAYPRITRPDDRTSDRDETRPEVFSAPAPAPEIQSPSRRGAPMSRADMSCRQTLKKLKVRYVDIKPINDSATCRIDRPIKVYAIGAVEMKPAATLNCPMAAAFAAWTRNELTPGARWKYLSGIKTIHQGSAYSCRRISGSRNMSAHSQGNALDVMAITLNNGKKIDIKKQGLFAFRARGLLNSVRADGCQYFSTVLGPGYNYDHRNHFHFDLMERRNGRVACH